MRNVSKSATGNAAIVILVEHKKSARLNHIEAGFYTRIHQQNPTPCFHIEMGIHQYFVKTCSGIVRAYLTDGPAARPLSPPLLCGMDWKPWTSAARSRGFAVQQMLTLSVSRFYTRDLWASAFSPNSGQWCRWPHEVKHDSSTTASADCPQGTVHLRCRLRVLLPTMTERNSKLDCLLS